MLTKTCKRCGVAKSEREFRFRPDKGLRVTACLSCESAMQAENYRRLKASDPLRWKVQVIRGGRSKHVTQEWLVAKLEEQAWRCALTGRPLDLLTLEVDHILARSAGGTDELSNLRLVAREANAAKGALTDDELVALCSDVLRTLAPELIGRAILQAERAA